MSFTVRHVPKFLFLRFFFLLAWLCPLSAQETEKEQEQAEDKEVIEEMVVTSTRRTTTVSKTGMAISVLGSEALKDLGAENFKDYLRTLPGISFTEGNAPGEQNLVIRGISFPNNRFMQSTVGVYLDEVSLTQNGRNPDLDLLDLERVEVLRGPQGTLYGSSSMGGTIRYITHKPDMQEFAANIQFGPEETEHGDLGYRVSAVINMPLIKEELALRVATYYRDLDGYIDNIGWANTINGYNIIDSSLARENANTEETLGARLSLRWLPSNKVTLDLNYTFHQTDVGALSNQNPNIGAFQQAARFEEDKDDELNLFSASLDVDLGLANMLFISSYTDRSFERVEDISRNDNGFDWWVGDFSAAYDPDCDCFTDQAGNLAGHAKMIRPIDFELVTHELRFTDNNDGPLHWVGGLYYSKTENNWHQNEVYPGAGSDFAPFVPFNYEPDYEAAANGTAEASYPSALYGLLGNDDWFVADRDESIEQLAAYGNLTYDINPKWDINFGFRWFTVDIKNRVVQSGVFAGGAVLAADDSDPGFVDFVLSEAANNYRSVGNPRADEDGSQFLLGSTYDLIDNAMIYATYAQGYRVGGINRNIPVRQGGTPPPENFDSDELDSFEFGWKTQWMDNRLQFNGSVFSIDWSDIQLSVTEPTTSFDYVANAGQAEITGIEFSTRFLPAKGWDMSLGATIMNHELTDVSQFAIDNGFDGQNGDPLPYVSDEAFYGSIRYETNLTPQFSGFAQGNYTYQSSYNTQLNPASSDFFKIDSFGILNLRLGLIGKGWQVALFAKNATDDDTIIFEARSPQGVSSGERGRFQTLRPRTIGITFAFDF